jgi:outer membrane biosynthesis protein TonB
MTYKGVNLITPGFAGKALIRQLPLIAVEVGLPCGRVDGAPQSGIIFRGMDRENRNVWIAVLLSLLLHVSAGEGWQHRVALMKLPVFSLLAKLVHVALPPPRPAPPQVQTLTFVELAPQRAPAPEVKKGKEAKQFMETDPSQVTGEKPKDAKYYSDKSTVAANPDNPTGKTGDTPYLNGNETRTPNTADVPTPSGVPAPLIRQPGSPSTPASIPKSAPKVAQVPPEPKPAPQPKTPEQPKEPAPIGLKIVEEQKLAMAPKPAAQPQVVTGATVPEVPTDPSTAAPGSAAIVTDPGVPGRELVARKAHLTVAGVSRSGIAAFGVAESPFGAYDKKLIKAVQSHWYALIDHYGIYESADVVTVKFELLDDGQVQNVSSSDSSQSRILSLFCEKAIIESGPFDPLTDELRALIGKEPREISFTFYY